MNLSFFKTSVWAAFLLFFFHAALILSLLTGFEGQRFREILLSPDTLFSIRLSLSTATLSTVLAVALGLPAGYALSRKIFFGKRAGDTILELPMIISPVALGGGAPDFLQHPGRRSDPVPGNFLCLRIAGHRARAVRDHRRPGGPPDENYPG